MCLHGQLLECEHGNISYRVLILCMYVSMHIVLQTICRQLGLLLLVFLQEQEIVSEEPVEQLVEQDPLFDPTVESAPPAPATATPAVASAAASQPELPVSTGGPVGTHILTSQPQLGLTTSTASAVAQQPAEEMTATEPEVCLQYLVCLAQLFGSTAMRRLQPQITSSFKLLSCNSCFCSM